MMKKVILGVVVVGAVAFLGGRGTTRNGHHAWVYAPQRVVAEASVPIKGSGFRPTYPVMVCFESIGTLSTSNCEFTQTDQNGEFLHYMTAPATAGPASIFAIQSIFPARGPGAIRTIDAEFSVAVYAVPME